MKLGTTDISKVYLGSTEVTKAYLGSTEVYSSGPEPWPSAYTRLNYVSNQGAAYFNTGIKATGDMTFDVNILRYGATSSSHFAMFGGGLNYNQTRNSVGIILRPNIAGDIQYIYRRSQSGIVLTIDTWYNVALKADGFYLNDSLANSITRTTFSGTFYDFYIGSYSNNLSAGAYIYIGVCKVNNYEYVPAKRNSDDVAGFYCMKNKTFYTSGSSTPFEAGTVYVET